MATLTLKKPSTRFNETSQQKPSQPGLTKTQVDGRRREKDAKAMTWLTGQYPGLFNPDAPRPLAVGIGKVIVADSPEGISRVTMWRVLERWTGTLEYLRTIAGVDFCYNLDATPAGAITDKHRRHARRLLEDKEAG